ITAINTRRRHSARVNTNNANAHATHKYSGFTRNQHATPSSTPAANATHTLARRALNTNNQQPASTNHVVGPSAEGQAPYNANNGESANKKLVAIAARQPKAVHAMPATKTNDTNRSTTHCTLCTAYAEG